MTKKRRPSSRPTTGHSSPPPRSPRKGGDPDAVLRQTPAWHFRSLDVEGPWKQRGLSTEQLLAKILPKLVSFETMSWSEIEAAAGGRSKGTNSHFIPIGNLAKEAQDRLDELGQADIDDLFSLRLSGKERVFGIRDGRVLRILWYDPDHRICPVRR